MNNNKTKQAIEGLSDEEKIIVNTGLGLMFQMIEEKVPLMNIILKDHPYKELLTLENIDKLHYKFKLSPDLESKQ
jgi:hypothetical protein